MPRKTRRQLQELIIRNYSDRSIEIALDAVKHKNHGLLRLMTDEAVYELAMQLGDDRRFSNRLNARNRAITAASRESGPFGPLANHSVAAE